MAFFAKSRRKLRTKNFEAHFYRKLRTLEKCSNVKKLRTTEPQLIFTGSYKKKKCIWMFRSVQGGYMRKIMVKIVATIVVASRSPNADRLQRRPLVPIH